MTPNLPAVRQDSTPALRSGSVPTIARDIIRPRLPEVGRIRLGERKGEKRYPAKLDAFRFTSRHKAPLETVAELWGGNVVRWDSDEGPQWQVYTSATSIEVIVPKAELAFSQHFEDWEGAVCNRRCDGHWEMQGDRECVCDPAARKCLPTTRLSVLLPDVPGMGVWRVESHGYNAAAEILGTIELAAAHGANLLPATLTLAQRRKRRPNPKTGNIETIRFVVPVLAISASLRQMVAEQQVLRQRTLGLLPMAELAGPQEMKGLRTAVFTRWPGSVDEPERSVRLRQLSYLLGREVTTISNEHDLTAQEAILLTNAVNELDEDTDPLASPEVASDEAGPHPTADGDAGPADSSAGEAPERGSAPRVAGASTVQAQTAVGTPAEPHSDEGPPPDSEAAESGQGTARKVGGSAAGRTAPAPTSARPKRTGPRPGAGSTYQQALTQKQKFEAERRAHTEVDHKPSRWLHTLPLKEKMEMIRAAAAYSTQPHTVVDDVAARVAPLYGKSLEAWTDAMDWDAEQIACLMQEIEQGGKS